MTFKTQIAADLDVFFNSDEFADSAIFTHGATVATIKVILDKEYDGSEGMGSYRYFMTAKTSDVAAAIPGDIMVINSVTYKVKEPPHHAEDGTSIIELSID